MKHNRHHTILLAMALLGIAGISQAGTVTTLQQQYSTAAEQPFSSSKGQSLWSSPQLDSKGEERACTSCHGQDLTLTGKHAVTGKQIDPMAPSVNGQRLTDAKKIEKWFKRNCKWTFGRECTPQEKGDFLSYLSSL